MSDQTQDQQQANSGVNDGAQAKDPQFSAELEKLRAQAAKYEALEKAAKEYEFDDPESYISALEDAAFESLNNQDNNQDNNGNANGGNTGQANQERQPEPQQAPPQPAKAAQPNLPEEYLKKLSAAEQTAAKAWFNSQWIEYYMQVPEADRQKLAENRAALTKLVSGPRAPFIADLAQKEEQFGGNIFRAAAAVLDMQNAAQTNRAASAAAAAAKDKAASSANIGTGGQTADPDMTPEKKREQEMKEYADQIAPTRTFEMPE